MSTFHWRKSSSVLLPCWKGEVCGKGGRLSMSIPDDICGTLSTLLLACFWSLLFPAPRTWFSARGILHCLFSPRSRFWCCQQWSLLLSLCPGCWASSSCPGGFTDPLLLCWSWIHIAFPAAFRATWRRVIRRQQISGSSGSPQFCRSVWFLFVFLATDSDHFPMNIAILCWRVRRTVDLLVSFPVWSGMHRSLCLLKLFLLAGCKKSLL